MTLINLEELKALIDSRVQEISDKRFIEIILNHDEIQDKLMVKLLNRFSKVLENRQNDKITPPSDLKSMQKRQDKITGREVQDILSPETKKERNLLLKKKLIELSKRNNKNKKLYNIGLTINYILLHPQKKIFILPELSDEIGMSTESLGKHLTSLNFKFDKSSRGWIKPERWES